MIISIDEMENQIPIGKIYHCYLKQALPFYGLSEMVVLIDRLMDETGSPNDSTYSRNIEYGTKKSNSNHVMILKNLQMCMENILLST